MNYIGLIIGITAFLIIGIFHPIVIWAEYHFSKKIWPLFACVGLACVILSLFFQEDIFSCILAVFGASCLWSIRELFQQEKRVQRGWFPKKEK